MAYEIPVLRFSLPSGAEVNRRRFVKVDSNGAGIQATAGDEAIGVSLVDTSGSDEVLEIVDGIAIVEAGEAISIGDIIGSDSVGRAATFTTGVPLGIAMSAAAAAGEMVTVKTPSVGTTASITYESASVTYSVPIEDLDADADIAARAILSVPTGYTYTITEIKLIMQGDTAGVDDANTSVITFDAEGDTVATVTYDTGNQPPAANAAEALTVANGERAADDILTIAVTNGTSADLPAFMVQITGSLAAAE